MAVPTNLLPTGNDNEFFLINWHEVNVPVIHAGYKISRERYVGVGEKTSLVYDLAVFINETIGHNWHLSLLFTTKSIMLYHPSLF